MPGWQWCYWSPATSDWCTGGPCGLCLALSRGLGTNHYNIAIHLGTVPWVFLPTSAEGSAWEVPFAGRGSRMENIGTLGPHSPPYIKGKGIRPCHRPPGLAPG